MVAGNSMANCQTWITGTAVPVVVGLITTVLCAGARSGEHAAWKEAPREIAPILAPFEMPQLERPVFPDRTVDIRDHGAIGDDKTKNTKAIREAIEACAKAGGGTVLVPEGAWLTGAVHLKSNVNLHLAEGALLRFSDDPEDYLPVVFTRWAGFECYNYSPLIHASNCSNIAVTGPGRIDGNGRRWWSWTRRGEATAWKMYQEQILKGVPPEKRVCGTPEAGLRPPLIQPINCKNVLLEGFTISNPGPFWTIHLVYCENAIVRGLTLRVAGGPDNSNNDGVDLDSCRNVLVEYCRFSTGDDCVALKSGMNEDGWRVGRPTENIVIRHIHAKRGHGGVVIGSDMSGGIKNVFVHDCHYENTFAGIRLKSTRGRGGVVENLWFQDITMDRVGHALQVTTQYRAYMGTTEGKVPTFRNIVLRNVTCRHARRAAWITGLPEQPIENVTLENVKLSADTGLRCTEVHGLKLLNVEIDVKKGMPAEIEHCRNLTMRDVRLLDRQR
ncbi:MAG: glycoside hydrolase family 28 protein [Pirellulales bacterium]|nr:glycoside hydrolase family 28 protein [Pirellulales bacterium]